MYLMTIILLLRISEVSLYTEKPNVKRTLRNSPEKEKDEPMMGIVFYQWHN